ncbi:MAG TPA: hypothetical protein VMZ03_03900 [Chitinophagaceae bacterium]|nr:hypothetical protein [Chitinophagaceae bacterium]
MAKISQSIDISGGVINFLVIIIYKTTAPAAEIDRIVWTAASDPNPFNYVFNDVDPGVYIVIIYESPDGSTLGNIRHDFEVDANTNTVLFERRHYRVNRGNPNDPVSGTTAITDPYFDGKTIKGVFQAGNRYLEPILEWTQLTGGVLQFGNDQISGGQITNNPDDVWSVEIMYTTIPPSGSGAAPFTDIVLESGNVTLDVTYDNKVIFGQSAGNKQTLTSRAIATIPEGRGFVIIHDSATAINLIFKAQVSEVIRFRGADVNQVVLGKGEMIKAIRKGSKLYVTEKNGQWDRVGDIVPGRQAANNRLLCDGMTEYDLTVYVRLNDYINSLPGAQVVDYATFATTATIDGEPGVLTKSGFFAKDIVSNKAKLPNLFNQSIRFLKNNGGADATRIDNIPSGYQHHKVGPHKHNLPADANGSSDLQSLVASANADEGFNTLHESAEYNTGGETVTRNIGFLPYLLI